MKSISLDLLTGEIIIDGIRDEYDVKPLYNELCDITIADGNNQMNDAFAATVETLIYMASLDNNQSTIGKVNSHHPSDILSIHRNFMTLEENLESANFVEFIYQSSHS